MIGNLFIRTVMRNGDVSRITDIKDSDWAGDIYSKTSTGGYKVLLNSALFSDAHLNNFLWLRRVLNLSILLSFNLLEGFDILVKFLKICVIHQDQP